MTTLFPLSPFSPGPGLPHTQNFQHFDQDTSEQGQPRRQSVETEVATSNLSPPCPAISLDLAQSAASFSKNSHKLAIQTVGVSQIVKREREVTRISR